MKKSHWKKQFTIFIALFLFSFIFSFNLAQGELLPSVKNPIVFQAQTTIPGVFTKGEKIPIKKQDTSFIADMIKNFYSYGIGIAGILAAIMLMAGGLVWLTSAGSSDKISQAKNLMSGSIVGLALLFSSWIMLRTINPALVDFRITSIHTIEKVTRGCCEYNNKAESMATKDCKSQNGKFFAPDDQGFYSPYKGKCSLNKVSCNIGTSPYTENVYLCFESDLKVAPGNNLGQELKPGRCANYKECDNVFTSCLDVEDGKPCKDAKGRLAVVNSYCFNMMCYLGHGKEGEPCGQKGGSCIATSKCKDLGLPGDYDNDYGGRICENSSLKCCYKVNK